MKTETPEHALFFCGRAKAIWAQWGWELSDEEESATVVLFRLIEKLEPKKLHELCSVVWSIWWSRNVFVWQNRLVPEVQVYREASQYFGDFSWLERKRGAEHVRRPRGSAWGRPPHGCYKCNLDAAFVEREGRGGFGAVLRDADGNWVGAICGPIAYCNDAVQAEFRSLLMAQKWLNGWQLGPIIFELDAQKIVLAIRSYGEDRSEIGVLAEQSRGYIVDNMHWQIAWVPRLCNQIADRLAQFALQCTGVVFFSEVPAFCAEIFA